MNVNIVERQDFGIGSTYLLGGCARKKIPICFVVIRSSVSGNLETPMP